MLAAHSLCTSSTAYYLCRCVLARSGLGLLGQSNTIGLWGGGGSEVLNRGLRKIWKEDKVCHKVLLFTVSFADKHATKTVCI